MNVKVDKILSDIAKEKLNLDSLEERKSDSLDFHEHSVSAIREALEEAFDAGYRMCAQSRG